MQLERLKHGTAWIVLQAEDAALLAHACKTASHHLYVTELDTHKQIATAALGAFFAALAIATESMNQMTFPQVDSLAIELHDLGLDVVTPARPVGQLAIVDAA